MTEVAIPGHRGSISHPAPLEMRSAVCGFHSRYRIPLTCPSAFLFYLDHLALPNSSADFFFTKLARQWPRLGHILLLAHKGRDGASRESQGAVNGPEAWMQQLNLEFCGRLQCNRPFFLTRNNGDSVQSDRTVSFVFDGSSPVPLAVAKLSSNRRQSSILKNEYQTLLRLSSHFEDAHSAFMPQPLDFFEESPWTVLLESWLPGRTAHFETRNSWDPLQYVPKHFRDALEWLLVFQKIIGAKVIPLDPSAANYYVVQPLEAFARRAHPSSAETDLITSTTSLAQRLLGTPMLLAPGHGDFWSGNLLLDKDSVGVIDWEHFRQEDFPFEDLFFFSIAYGLSFPWKPGHRADSQTAFRATYLQATPIADQVRSFLLSYCNAMGLATELLELFFPVFLARRALEELGPGGIEEYPEVRFVRSGMWRNFLRIYAERGEPACFIDRRRKWRGMPCARSC